MTLEELKGLAEEAVRTALAGGAATAEATVKESDEFEVEVRRGRIEKLLESVSNSISITVSIDRRRSNVSSSDLHPGSVRQLIADGIELARVMQSDEYFDLPERDELGTAPGDLRLFDPATLTLPTEKKISLALALEDAACRLDGRIIPDGAAFSSAVGRVAIANSLGFSEAFVRSANRLDIACAVEDRPSHGENVGKKQSSYWYSRSVSPHELEPVDAVAARAVERTLRKIGARKPATCEVSVIFDPETARDFLDSLADAASGGGIYRKSSFLVDKLGASIGSELVTVIDDALMPAKPGTRPFDHEGVRSRRNVVIERGVLRSYLLSSYQARKLGLRTTGNSGGPSNFYLEPGPHTSEEIIASVKNGLYLTALSGPGANWSTGDFSQGAQGLWIENGRIAYPVNEFTVAGTFIGMLAGITMVGNDIEWRSAIAAPTFKIEKMTVSGT